MVARASCAWVSQLACPQTAGLSEYRSLLPLAECYKLKLKTDKLEQLELVLRGCVGKCAKNGDRIVHQHRQPLVQEGFLAVVISDWSDVPSYVVHTLNSIAVDLQDIFFRKLRLLENLTIYILFIIINYY